jgi:dihydroorotate dehydrogenase electron transfer subunit
MIQQKAIVKWNKPVGGDCFHMALITGQALEKVIPGQFVMIQIDNQESPLLRRPFSISGLIREDDRIAGIELLIKVVGKGTRRLAQMQPGDALDLLGPLGHGFRFPPNANLIYLAAGGIGVAPIRFLAVELLTHGVAPESCRLYLGGRSKQDLICREDFTQLGIAVTVTTDDGSDGDQCLITDPLELAIQEQAPDMVYACGPHGMLACVAGIARRTQVPCQVSIETLMACGLGACLGCAVESKKDAAAYLHACVNGPVFNAADINL